MSSNGEADVPQYDDGSGYQDQEKEANNEEDDSNENSTAGFESTDFASDDLDPPKQEFGQPIQQGYDEDQEAGWSYEEPAKSQGSQDPEVKQEFEELAAQQEQFEEAQEQPEVKHPEPEQSQQQVTSVKGESYGKYFTHTDELDLQI